MGCDRGQTGQPVVPPHKNRGFKLEIDLVEPDTIWRWEAMPPLRTVQVARGVARTVCGYKEQYICV